MQVKQFRVYSLALLAVTFWGLSYVWYKVVYEYYDPATTMFLRLLISSVLMVTLVRVLKLGQKIEKKDYWPFVLLSFFSPFCYFIGESYGLLYVSPTVASVVIATIPVFSPLLAFIAFREKVAFINILGFIISFSGVLIMVLDNQFRFSASPLGLFLLFFAVGSALINILFLKKLAVKYSSFTIISVQNVLGALFFLPVFLVTGFSDFITIRPTWELAGAVLALAVFGSTLAFIFYTSSVRAIGIARTAIFTNLIPVVTAISSFLILKEIIDLSKIVGMAVVIGGLLLTQANSLRQRHQQRKQQAFAQKKP
ncbi:MAG: DMT family transporter [Bacteroidales bacterium]